MERVIVVLGNANIDPTLTQLQADWVGVDRGAFLCAESNIHMRYAIGDFDSVTQIEFEKIQMFCYQLIQLEKEKNESDFEAALTHLVEYQEILVLGSWAPRFDHGFVNLELIKRDSRITFLDSNNKTKVYDVGNHIIEKEHYEYLSVFALEDSTISLMNVKYPLVKRHLSDKDLYTLSNEIVSEKAELDIEKGKLLVILSKD